MFAKLEPGSRMRRVNSRKLAILQKVGSESHPGPRVCRFRQNEMAQCLVCAKYVHTCGTLVRHNLSLDTGFTKRASKLFTVVRNVEHARRRLAD